ncbi:MAG: transposase domain-containing protein [Gammaproteobacteria bacterium]
MPLSTSSGDDDFQVKAFGWERPFVRRCFAKANGVEPHAYLSLLFAQLPYARTVEDFETLLPWNLRPALAPASSQLGACKKADA